MRTSFVIYKGLVGPPGETWFVSQSEGMAERELRPTEIAAAYVFTFPSVMAAQSEHRTTAFLRDLRVMLLLCPCERLCLDASSISFNHRDSEKVPCYRVKRPDRK
jgi:hypothetical protein